MAEETRGLHPDALGTANVPRAERREDIGGKRKVGKRKRRAPVAVIAPSSLRSTVINAMKSFGRKS